MGATRTATAQTTRLERAITALAKAEAALDGYLAAAADARPWSGPTADEGAVARIADAITTGRRELNAIKEAS